ncbi:Cytochrome c-554 precursor [Planctomycetes bacterium Pla163]|uniref:Cytochrome c-554 n=1 Tax=Rohdeia mirabilis TaxID=2528008 RepID=A0A518D0M6_9BACT|nr:Cytochrome c-554 precursor [Planctomycetes bacterium Pla163]
MASARTPRGLTSGLSCVLLLLLTVVTARARSAQDSRSPDADVFETLGLERSPKPDLKLVFTGSLEGFIEPCGCTAGRLGGMDRLVTHLRESRSAALRSIHVDTGDTFLHADDLTPALRRQLPLKADAIMAMLADSGCDAIALGDYDIEFGLEELRALSERYSVPILCSNVFDREGEPYFKRGLIVERDGVRIGIFSLLAQNLVHPDLHDDTVLRVGEQIAEAGLVLRPWREVAQRAARDLRPLVDVLVCASHLGGEANLELAELCPEIDVVCGPHFAGREAPHDVVGNTLVSHVSLKGARTTEFDLWFGGVPPGPDARVARGATDASDRIVSEFTLEVSATALRSLVGREAVLGPNEHARLKAFNRGFVQTSKDWLESAGDFPDGRVFAVSKPSMHRNLVRDEMALDRIDGYHAQVEEFWSSQRPKGSHTGDVFADPASCASCHPDQYEFWKTTRHARAYSTLAITQQQFDAECFACHTVGFGEEGGFDRPHEAAGYENVQCAACHGPGAAHMAGGASYLNEKLLTKVGSTCVECHNKQHDPEFFSWVEDIDANRGAIEAKVLKIACPSLPPPGAGTPEFKQSLTDAAFALASRKNVDWPLLVRLYHSAGRVEEAIACARAWCDTKEATGASERLLGLLLVDDGRNVEAVPALRKALEVLGSDPEVHFSLARALLTDDPQAALVQAREAYSIAPERPPHAEAVVRALDFTGDRAGAVAFLDMHVARFTDQRALFQPLRDELTAPPVEEVGDEGQDG